MDRESGFAPVARLIDDAIRRRAFPCAAIEVGSRAGPVWSHAAGTLSYDGEETATLDTVFDLASLTKVLATSTVLMRLVDARALTLADRVGGWLTEWRGTARETVTVADLLEHAGGLTAHLPFFRDHRGRADYQHAICTLPLEYPPRQGSLYTDLGFILLAFIAADAGGAAVDEQFDAIASRLRIGDLRYRPPRRGVRGPRRPRSTRGGGACSAARCTTRTVGPGRRRGSRRPFRDRAGGGPLCPGRPGDAEGAAPAGPPRDVRAVRAAHPRPRSSRALGWDTMLVTSSCGRSLSPPRSGIPGSPALPVAGPGAGPVRRAADQPGPSDPGQRGHSPGPPRGPRRGGLRVGAREPSRVMVLTPLDWLILAGFLVLPVAVALSVAGRAQESLRQYFLAGGELPWWIAGTSMVATTFAADTPLAVTGIVARDGVAGNWIWGAARWAAC